MINRINLRDKYSGGNNVDINSINSVSERCPALLIETNKIIKINSPFMYVDEICIDLETHTIGSLSEHISNLGISSKLFSPKLKMHPAIMLADFSNNIYSTFDIYSSPTDISAKIGKAINNILSIDDVNIDIISVYNNKEKLDFHIVDNNLYTPIVENSKALSKITINKFIIHVQKEKIISLDRFVKDRNTVLTKKVLDKSTSIIKGI